MQPMLILHQVCSGIKPIQTRPHFVIRTFCRGEATGTPWPLPYEMLNSHYSERIPQTFFIVMQIPSHTTWNSPYSTNTDSQAALLANEKQPQKYSGIV